MTRKLLAVMAAASVFLTSAVSYDLGRSNSAQKETPVAMKPPEPKTPFLLGKDGYVFEGKEYALKKNFRVELVVYPNFYELRKAYGDIQSDVVAFAYSPNAFNNTCTIHLVDPSIVYEPEYTGHELIHCMYGNFHKIQDKTGKYRAYKR